jgi:CBS domain-containing protein
MFKVAHVMESPVITVTKDTTVYDAMLTLRKYNITGTPVINDNGTLAGIITEKDLLPLLYAVHHEDEPRVEEFMTKNVVSFDINDDIIDIVECFARKGFRRVPILADGKVIGIISRKDIIDYILKIRKIDEAQYYRITHCCPPATSLALDLKAGSPPIS